MVAGNTALWMPPQGELFDHAQNFRTNHGIIHISTSPACAFLTFSGRTGQLRRLPHGCWGILNSRVCKENK